MKPTYFATPAAFRAWLARHHATRSELLVGFRKVGTGAPSITWPESVDQALCFGWIDGVRKRIDAASYTIRFTPRKATSTWSAINVARVAVLAKRGQLEPAGRAAFARRSPAKSGTYAYEQRRTATLAPPERERFRADAKAWTFFRAQAPSYQRTATWWVVSAKKEETRRTRLAKLIGQSAKGRRLA